MKEVVTLFLLLSLSGAESAVKCDQKSSQVSLVDIEKDLHGCLLKDYYQHARPVERLNQTVTVNFSMGAMRIDDIEEKTQMLQLKGWTLQTWKDHQLTWNPDSYGKITEIRVPVTELWVPDTTLYNYAESVTLSDNAGSMVIIKSDGTVVYVPAGGTFKCFCELDLTHFPYDSQRCPMFFGAWASNVNRVNLTVGSPSTKLMYEGHEWKNIKAELQREEFDFGKEYGGKYSVIIYTLSMERNPIYYRNLFVVPTVLMAVVCMLIYLVPPEAGERLTLCGSVLIVCTLLLLMLDNHLPTEVAQAPLVLQFLVYIIVMDLFAGGITVMSLNFHYRDIKKGKVPNWMRKIFLGKLTRYLCIRGDVYASLPSNEDELFDDNTTELPSASGRNRHLDHELTSDTPLPKSPTLAIEKTLDEIRRYLRICAAREQAPVPVVSHKQIVVNEWHLVALVLDRLALVFFIVLTIFVMIVMAAV